MMCSVEFSTTRPSTTAGHCAQAHTRPTGAPEVQRNKENVPSLSISVAELSIEMHKHIDPCHAPALRALLVALKTGLGLESFCRRVHREMGPDVLRRTLRGLFELAQVRDKKIPARIMDERIHALALAKRRYFEREQRADRCNEEPQLAKRVKRAAA